MFLATIAHETMSFRKLTELASGEKYEKHKGFGNATPGDGVRFKGRGFI
jgi:putative chitinase